VVCPLFLLLLPLGFGHARWNWGIWGITTVARAGEEVDRLEFLEVFDLLAWFVIHSKCNIFIFKKGR
jgi:hypothetical protein